MCCKRGYGRIVYDNVGSLLRRKRRKQFLADTVFVRACRGYRGVGFALERRNQQFRADFPVRGNGSVDYRQCDVQKGQETINYNNLMSRFRYTLGAAFYEVKMIKTERFNSQDYEKGEQL